MAERIKQPLASAPWVEGVDLKELIEDGRADGEILEAMSDQINKTTASAEVVVDEALAEIDASNQRIEAMRSDANGKAS